MKADFTPKEKQDYLDRGWIDGEEMAALVTEIIIEQTNKDSDFDRPMIDSEGGWYLSRSNVIDKLHGLVEQRDHLVETLGRYIEWNTRQRDDLFQLQRLIGGMWEEEE